MKPYFLLLAALLIFSDVAFAAGYSEIYVAAAPKEKVDVAVETLRNEAFAAARNGDIEKFQAMFAAQVAIYSASSDPGNLSEDEFKLVEKVARDMVFAKIAAQVVDAKKVTEKQLMRSGFFAAARLLRGPEIGFNGKMNGAVCNRPVNKPKPEEFAAALEATKSRIADWVVAKRDMGPSDVADAPGQYPTTIYKDQMVLVTKETHGDKRWTSIAALDGGKSLFYENPQSYSIAPYFARYVTQHVCFGKEDGVWKITAIAFRNP